MEIHDDRYLFQISVASKKVNQKPECRNRVASVRTDTVPERQKVIYYRVNVIIIG